MRQHLAWSSLFRHRMRDPLLIEGVDPSPRHHRRLRRRALRHALRDDVEAGLGRVRGRHRRHRDACCSTTACAPSTRARCRNAVGLNTFYKEYIRVDGEHGTAILNHRDVEVFMRQDIWRQQNREGQGQKIALLTQPKWINHWLIEQFAQWRDGGPPMETRVEENVQASRAGLRRDREPAHRAARSTCRSSSARAQRRASLTQRRVA